MEIRFDNEQHHGNGSETRIYDPTGRKSAPLTAVDRRAVPIADETELDVRVPRSELRFSDSSKIMILISVFLIALTALISLFGASEYARISTEIETVKADIQTYEQQISQVRKTQSSMNDYASITDACLDRGMQMIWEPDVFGSRP